MHERDVAVLAFIANLIHAEVVGDTQWWAQGEQVPSQTSLLKALLWCTEG